MYFFHRCVPVYSRAQGKFVLRPQRAPKRYVYVAEMLRKMIELRKDVAISGPRPMSANDPRRIHPYINPGTRPTPEGIQELKEQRKANKRFP